MKQYIYLIIASSLFSLSSYAQKETWSLENCMEYAITHNLQIQQRSLDLEDAELNEKNAKNVFLPDLDAGIRNGWSRGFSPGNSGVLSEQNTRSSRYTIDAGIPIYNGLRNYNRLQRRRLQKIATKYNIEGLKDDIRLSIANNYLQILLQQENLEVLKANHEITLQQIDRTQTLIQAGSLPEGDILELEATSANEIQRITASQNSVAIAILGLKRLLNIEFSKTFVIEKIEPQIDELELLKAVPENIIEDVLENRNEIKLAKQNVVIAEQDIKITKGNFYPTVTGNIGYSTRETVVENSTRSTKAFFDQLNQNKNLNFGLAINIPIFSKFLNKNTVERNKVNVLRSQYQLEQAKQRLTQNVYEAFLDAQASQKSFEAAQTAVDAQKNAYEFAKSRYEIGASNSFDFSQSQIRYQNSQTQLIRSKYDLLFKLKLLDLYVGSK